MKRKIFLLSIIFIIVFTSFGCSNKEIKFKGRANDYNIVAEYNDIEKTLSCTQKVSYINDTDNVLNEICFYLHANAFSEGVKNKPVSFLNEQKAYPNGKSYGGIDVISVKNKKNNLRYEICGEDDNILKILLDFDFYPDDKFQIDINYVVKLANINHRLGYGDNTINFGNFFPIACVFKNGEFITNPYSSNGDPFYSKISNFEVCLTYDKDFVLASTGNANTKEQGDKKISNITAKSVRDFVFVLSKNFKVLEGEYKNTKIKYYYYNDENPDKSLQTSIKSIKTFSELFGKYPYDIFSVVEANFVHGGMEYPNLVMISDSLETDDIYQNVIVHETAHQWWYGVVGNDQFNFGYLDEGLTEYSTALFYEYNDGYAYTLEGIIKSNIQSYSVFVKVYSDVYGSVNTSMDRALNEYATEPEYVYTAYVKSMLMFDSLRKILGNEKFIKCLQKYYKTFAYKEVCIEDLISCFEKYGRKNLENFFDSWINDKVIVFTE